MIGPQQKAHQELDVVMAVTSLKSVSSVNEGLAGETPFNEARAHFYVKTPFSSGRWNLKNDFFEGKRSFYQYFFHPSGKCLRH